MPPPTDEPGTAKRGRGRLGTRDGDGDDRRADTRADIDGDGGHYRRDIDSVRTATDSVAGEIWQGSDHIAITRPEDGEDLLLDAESSRLYRGVAARLNYVAPDRPDLAYAVKEAARAMSSPKESDLRKLKKIGKYLIGAPRLVSTFQWQDMPSRLTSFTDSDWAGCSRTARSTSGGAVCLGEHVLKTYCRQQGCGIELSGG